MVVTIVVLLILAGVSISLIIDNNGIIKKSKDARREYRQAQANEQADLDNASDWIDEATAEPTPKVNVNEKATDNSTINGKKGNSNNPTIPEGYIPINTDTSEWGDGTSAPTQNDIEHGLVIRDNSNNEWVWIPVPDVNVMCDTVNTTEYTLCGIENITTKLYTRPIKMEWDSSSQNPYEAEEFQAAPRGVPGNDNSYREPDLVVDDDGASYDAKEEYYKTILGFDSKEKMAEAFVADYSEMLESIRKYGGFYIGRYELSEAGVQKNQPTLTYTNWYNLYAKCKSLNASKKVETRMIWGCQWDVTCNFIANKGDKKDIADSNSWGNYYSTSVKADDGTTEIKARETELALNTGVTTFTMANNIYDLAGNCWEWTQEANNDSKRVGRGGNYGHLCNSSEGSVLSRGTVFPDSFPDSSSNSILRYTSYFNNKVG